MRIFGLDIVRHSHYEHLVSQCTKLAIENVNFNKDRQSLELQIQHLLNCINIEGSKKEYAKRDNKGRFTK